MKKIRVHMTAIITFIPYAICFMLAIAVYHNQPDQTGMLLFLGGMAVSGAIYIFALMNDQYAFKLYFRNKYPPPDDTNELIKQSERIHDYLNKYDDFVQYIIEKRIIGTLVKKWSMVVLMFSLLFILLSFLGVRSYVNSYMRDYVKDMLEVDLDYRNKQIEIDKLAYAAIARDDASKYRELYKLRYKYNNDDVQIYIEYHHERVVRDKLDYRMWSYKNMKDSDKSIKSLTVSSDALLNMYKQSDDKAIRLYLITEIGHAYDKDAPDALIWIMKTSKFTSEVVVSQFMFIETVTSAFDITYDTDKCIEYWANADHRDKYYKSCIRMHEENTE